MITDRVPQARGQRERGDNLLTTWCSHPNDVPLGYWEFMDYKWYVTRVEPFSREVYMTPTGKKHSVDSRVYGYRFLSNA